MPLEKHFLLLVRKKGSGLHCCETQLLQTPSHWKTPRWSLALASKKRASKLSCVVWSSITVRLELLPWQIKPLAAHVSSQVSLCNPQNQPVAGPGGGGDGGGGDGGGLGGMLGGGGALGGSW